MAAQTNLVSLSNVGYINDSLTTLLQ